VGLATTAANPYFFLWWATVGATLLANSRAFSTAGVVALGIAHWLCDLFWLSFISWLVFKSKRLWIERVRRTVFATCAAILARFGAWFIFTSLELATAS